MSKDAASLARRAALASVAAAILLAGAKIWAVAATGSISMLGSLADTGLDLLASLITLFAVRVAAEPADQEHRFGHGKAEAVAALIQTVLIVISGLYIALQGLLRLLEGGGVADPEYGVVVSVFALMVTAALVLYQRSVIARTESIAIQTDSLHYQSDLLLNLAVISALLIEGLSRFTGADAVFGLGIAAWLLWNAYRAGRRAVDMLMDREWPELKRQQLLNLVSQLPDVDGVHDLRTRRAGHQDFVQFHIWVDPELSVASAHDIAERAEIAVRERFPAAEVLIHVDPRGHLDDLPVKEDHFCPIEPGSGT
ncbi:divalent metal cation transporter FieF [Pacificimonas flava]|uniref:Protein p34 n=2 Tax=Pacificimonas TaxID=1960290 RepID=A0A219B0Z8_9SPHN|nr:MULTISPECIES: cation diffusion facilitator family transporter [Pacificimonas]MBZ6379719.1 cation diffusion facilitator family transporter [Pacificimonas aurantium]OWV31823.1 divalent metal cation transporter FieF [Pacificimonas flava]